MTLHTETILKATIIARDLYDNALVGYYATSEVIATDREHQVRRLFYELADALGYTVTLAAVDTSPLPIQPPAPTLSTADTDEVQF